MSNKHILRIDKFLWATRICRTRKSAFNLCNKNKIKINDFITKPSKRIALNVTIEINRNNIKYKYIIKKITKNRISAKLVPDFLDDITSEVELNKLKIRKIYPVVKREKGMGRPTKKERRNLIKHKLIN